MRPVLIFFGKDLVPRRPLTLIATVAVAVAVAAAATVAAAGCADDAPSATHDARLGVVASFFPLRDAAERVGGEHVEVTDLTPSGTEPHHIELTPRQTGALSRADVVLYLSHGFQPHVEKAVGALPSTVRRVDLLDGQALRPADTGIPGVRGEVDGGAGDALTGGGDPHVWLDPQRHIIAVQAVADAFAAADPAHGDDYRRNAARYVASLQRLDRDFATTLGACRSTVLVTSHAAFGYLADRYGLTQAAIAGITPEDEPDPASLAALARYARGKGVRTVYFETLVPGRLSRTLAREIGAGTDLLNPIEGLTREEEARGVGYVELQRDNLARIAKGLGCAQ
ncbi:MAG: metal ABC transporter substrate-binding protein [Actinomycetota bacterium]